MMHAEPGRIIAATHTPFDASGALALGIVERQAEHLVVNGVTTAFIGGTTGEAHSMTVDERLALAERWFDVARGTPIGAMVHVGTNCLEDAKALAAHAAGRARAVAALAPSYFKPATVDALIDWCAAIAACAPDTPFYFYDIPALTGVRLSMPEFLARGRERIPTLAGIKWTNPDLYGYQLCLRVPGGFDLPWGNDEYLLSALAVGARGAVGSTYNFAAPVYQRLLTAFDAGDLATARDEQFRSVQLVQVLASYGYMGAAKALMGMLGVPVGPARLPNTNPGPEQTAALRRDLEQLGFFDWLVRRGAGLLALPDMDAA
jgi:N-acetylneuraminate lyase